MKFLPGLLPRHRVPFDFDIRRRANGRGEPDVVIIARHVAASRQRRRFRFLEGLEPREPVPYDFVVSRKSDAAVEPAT